jgi:hypothetical protein
VVIDSSMLVSEEVPKLVDIEKVDVDSGADIS